MRYQNCNLWNWLESSIKLKFENEEYAQLYHVLWSEADVYASENLKGDEARYFFRTTD